MRFEFGKNWQNFSREISMATIQSAENSLTKLFGENGLKGKLFLDVGSGSGLFSLAARRMGASVISFDYDPNSVACTQELKDKFFKNDPDWHVFQANVLDLSAMDGFNPDIIYSWGVVHHTGDMNLAIDNIINCGKRSNSKIMISAYNDQLWLSKYWLYVKRAYNINLVLRCFIIIMHFPYLFIARYLIRLVSGRLEEERGMKIWYDMLDWLGGYPFEYAKPEVIFRQFQKEDYVLTFIKTCGGSMGCNEFVFEVGKKST